MTLPVFEVQQFFKIEEFTLRLNRHNNFRDLFGDYLRYMPFQDMQITDKHGTFVMVDTYTDDQGVTKFKTTILFDGGTPQKVDFSINDGGVYDAFFDPYPAEEINRKRILITLLYALGDFAESVHSGSEMKFCKLTDKQKSVNAKRVKNGKKPIYDFKTIKIKPSVYYKPTGATRDSIRSAHQRRGHFRNLQSGKKVWVKDCKVSEGHMKPVKYVFEYE